MAGSAIERIRSRARRGFRGFPIGTVAFYGPTNEFASKVAVSIVVTEGAEPGPLERWHAASVDVRHDPAIAKRIWDFLEVNQARSVSMSRGIIGCPHEEGIDYPEGAVCPKCPFWAGRDRWKEV